MDFIKDSIVHFVYNRYLTYLDASLLYALKESERRCQTTNTITKKYLDCYKQVI